MGTQKGVSEFSPWKVPASPSQEVGREPRGWGLLGAGSSFRRLKGRDGRGGDTGKYPAVALTAGGRGAGRGRNPQGPSQGPDDMEGRAHGGGPGAPASPSTSAGTHPEKAL